jgi:transcriptional regulator with XRE-family HTH domain
VDLESALRRLGRNVRRARWAAGLTQAQLASSGISMRYLGEIERGARNPSFETIFRLARLLNTSASVLVDIENVASTRARTRLESARIVAPKRGRKPKPTGARRRT